MVTELFQTEKEKIAGLEAGSIISVYWPKDREYYTGTIAEICSSKKLSHHIRYDDGVAIGRTCAYRKFKVQMKLTV